MKIKDYIDIIEEAKCLIANISDCRFKKIEEFGHKKDVNIQISLNELWNDKVDNKIFYANNIKLLSAMAKNLKFKEKFSLIYIDPPFFTKAKYHATVNVGDENIRHLAYEDRWENGKEDYLVNLAARLLLMKEILSEDGLIWLHLDWHIVHYAKILMDEIFGESNFVNEVIWTYKSGGSSSRRFSRKHDNLLVYSKSSKYKFNPQKEKSYNRQFKPYRFKGVEEYEDELGWYTLVNMKDVWNIDMVGRTSKERTGYATQKPEALLERIVSSSTSEGDLCGDFFSGSGTLAAVCEKIGRKYVVCDESKLAVESSIKRMLEQKSSFQVFQELDCDCNDRNSNSMLNLVENKGEVKLEDYDLTRFKINILNENELKYWSLGHIEAGVFYEERTGIGNKNNEEIYVIDKAFFNNRKVSIKLVDGFGNSKYIELK